MPALIAIYGAAALTNSVFTNALENICRELHRWQLPIACPPKAEDIQRFSYREQEAFSFDLKLKPGWRLSFNYGLLTGFEGPEYPEDRSPPRPGEKVNITPVQAL